MTKEAKSKQVAPAKGKSQGQRKVANRLEPPKDKTLKLTIPEMKQIEDDTIPTGKGTNEALFHDHAAVHLRDTGFPWQRTANVYIAGHRIGFPGTDSNLAFYDLEDLKNGDKVYLEDAEGREYTYQVFAKLIVEPANLSVLKPIRARTLSVCRPARCLITQNVSSTGPCSRTSRRKHTGRIQSDEPTLRGAVPPPVCCEKENGGELMALSKDGGPAFGAHAFIWSAEWTREGAERVLSGAADAGLDFVEIPLLDPAR